MVCSVVCICKDKDVILCCVRGTHVVIPYNNLPVSAPFIPSYHYRDIVFQKIGDQPIPVFCSAGLQTVISYVGLFSFRIIKILVCKPDPVLIMFFVHVGEYFLHSAQISGSCISILPMFRQTYICFSFGHIKPIHHHSCRGGSASPFGRLLECFEMSKYFQCIVAFHIIKIEEFVIWRIVMIA